MKPGIAEVLSERYEQVGDGGLGGHYVNAVAVGLRHTRQIVVDTGEALSVDDVWLHAMLHGEGAWWARVVVVPARSRRPESTARGQGGAGSQAAAALST